MIIVASCGHYSDDERIYYKQINTLKKISASIEYFTYNESMDMLVDDCVNHYHFNSKKYSQSQYKKELFEFALNHKPRILHIHDLELLPVARKIKLKNKNIKIIYDIHEDLVSLWDAFSSYSGIIKNLINTALSNFELFHLKHVDCCIVANKFADLNRYKNFAPVHIVQNFPIKNKVEDKTNIGAPYKLIYHGQLDEGRGIINLIDAFNYLSKQHNQLKLKIIGTVRKDFFNHTMHDRAKNNCNIEILKSIPHRNVWNMLYDSHIGVIPFHDLSMFQKNTPTKLFEFMASGCAVVSSRLKPVCAFSNDSISFFHPSSVDSLVEAIEFYLTNIDLYNEHITSNKELVKKQYSWENQSKEIIKIYDGLMS